MISHPFTSPHAVTRRRRQPGGQLHPQHAAPAEQHARDRGPHHAVPARLRAGGHHCARGGTAGAGGRRAQGRWPHNLDLDYRSLCGAKSRLIGSIQQSFAGAASFLTHPTAKGPCALPAAWVLQGSCFASRSRCIWAPAHKHTLVYTHPCIGPILLQVNALSSEDAEHKELFRRNVSSTHLLEIGADDAGDGSGPPPPRRATSINNCIEFDRCRGGGKTPHIRLCWIRQMLWPLAQARGTRDFRGPNAQLLPPAHTPAPKGSASTRRTARRWCATCRSRWSTALACC